MLKGTFFLLTLLLFKGEALPSSATANGSTNSSAVNAVSTTERNTSCGQVTTNVIIQGGGDGVEGPQGERGRTGPPGPAGPPGAATANTGGVSFTRWGRTTCPGGTQRLYEGTVAGSQWDQAGSAEYLCLHKQPQFLRTTPGVQGDRAYIYGTEYRAIDSPPAFSNIAHHDAPCAVCYAPTRNAKITIPARTSCPPSWTREYYGYLMADKFLQNHKSRVPLCVDANSESVRGSAAEHPNSLLYFIETKCNGIACPPYFNGAEISCVVCTK